MRIDERATLMALILGFPAVLVFKVPAAGAHDNGIDSVENGEQVYEDTTKYDDARIFAQGAWDGHISINIRHDDWQSITDVEWGDYSSNSNTWGVWQERTPGADDIRMNSFVLDALPSGTQQQALVKVAKIRYVALHEEGHSLRIAHTIPGDLMASGEAGSTINTITAHAHCDYHTLWGTPAGHSSGCGK
jgi:hypothetical protein